MPVGETGIFRKSILLLRTRNQSFRAPFSKGADIKSAELLSRSAEREISHRRFLFDSFFFCGGDGKRKSGLAEVFCFGC